MIKSDDMIGKLVQVRTNEGWHIAEVLNVEGNEITVEWGDGTPAGNVEIVTARNVYPAWNDVVAK